MKRALCLLLAAIILPSLAWAHFLIAIPEKGQGYGLRGQELAFMILFGHPFEGILYDLKAPKGYVVTPKNTKDKVSLARITVKDYASGKKRFGYRITYLPTERGDYLLCLEGQPYLNEEEGEVWKDHMKIPFHVQVERGWANLCGFGLEIVPLTRPYGLTVGRVFKGRVLLNGKPAAGITLEIEKFNGFYVPEEKLPLDAYGRVNDPLITLTVTTDEQGYFTVGFSEPGWWVINAAISGGKITYANRTFPLVIRSGMWLYVFPAKPVAPTGFNLRPEEK